MVRKVRPGHQVAPICHEVLLRSKRIARLRREELPRDITSQEVARPQISSWETKKQNWNCL